MKKLFRLHRPKGSERGFSLLEYCAGAAVIMVTVWAALNAMGTNISNLLGAIGEWATKRQTEIQGAGSQGTGGSSSSASSN